MIGAVKLLALSILIALQCACENEPVDHYNRRNLYDPDAAPTLRRVVAPTPAPEAKPQFR